MKDKKRKDWHPYKNWQDDDSVIQNIVKKLLIDLRILRKKK